MPANDTTLVITTTLAIYRDAAKEASFAFVRTWLALPATILAYWAFMIAGTLVQPLGMAGGFILGLLVAAILTLYYSWVQRAVQRERLRFPDLLQFEMPIFFSIIGVGFVLWVINYALDFIVLPPDLEWARFAVLLLLVIFFNAIPEVVYNHRLESVSALSSAAAFIKENWVEWFVPFAVLVAPWLVLSSGTAALHLAMSSPLIPTGVLMVGVARMIPPSLVGSSTIIALIGLAVAHWFMLFRGFLFIDLESGSRRQRMYRARQR